MVTAGLFACGRSQSITIEWTDGTPSIDLPHLEDGERYHRMAPKKVDDGMIKEVYPERPESEQHETVEVSSTGQARSPADMPPPVEGDTTATEVPRGSMRAALKRLGVRLPRDEQSLRAALLGALQKARMPLLRGLLFERGGKCVGCSERQEFIQAVLASLRLPLVGRHALPLFLYDQPLFPHSQTGLTLYEPRYKLLCRKALKADRYFGFVSGTSGVGTLAKIKSWRFADDDPKDGNCLMTIAGVRRFKLGRQVCGGGVRLVGGGRLPNTNRPAIPALARVSALTMHAHLDRASLTLTLTLTQS